MFCLLDVQGLGRWSCTRALGLVFTGSLGALCGSCQHVVMHANCWHHDVLLATMVRVGFCAAAEPPHVRID
jgi:hypothetical protein